MKVLLYQTFHLFFLLVETHGFDGLDLDWEYPKCWQVDCDKGPESDKEAFALWVKELRAAFDSKGRSNLNLETLGIGDFLTFQTFDFYFQLFNFRKL